MAIRLDRKKRAARPWSLRGTEVQGFTVQSVLGKGSFGIVYKVVRAADKQTYALKVIDSRTMSQRERSHAVNEIRLLASVSDAHVVRFYEAFVDNDKLHIVTEFAKCGDLARKLKKCKDAAEPLTEEVVWSYFLQLCMGLRDLHVQNILHRDLKPANVLLITPECVKLADLGVAKFMGDANRMAKTQCGTPAYFSPELWKNRPYNDKSDVWALGCLLYEMMELRVPFTKAKKVMWGVYAPVSGHYSADLGQLVKQLLVVNPNERLSVEEILNLDTVRHRYLAAIGSDRSGDCSFPEEGPAFVRTIKVPRRLKDLGARLPQPRYSTDNTDGSGVESSVADADETRSEAGGGGSGRHDADASGAQQSSARVPSGGNHARGGILHWKQRVSVGMTPTEVHRRYMLMQQHQMPATARAAPPRGCNTPRSTKNRSRALRPCASARPLMRPRPPASKPQPKPKPAPSYVSCLSPPRGPAKGFASLVIM